MHRMSSSRFVQTNSICRPGLTAKMNPNRIQTMTTQHLYTPLYTAANLISTRRRQNTFHAIYSSTRSVFTLCTSELVASHDCATLQTNVDAELTKRAQPPSILVDKFHWFYSL
jgi:hypothetical protein